MSKKLTTQEFIEKALKIHGDKYDYSLVNYQNNKTKVAIVCPIHGEFELIPNSHLLGNGCPRCAIDAKKQCKPKTIDLFIIDSKAVHGNKYDYSKVTYKAARTKVIIICPIHGEFELTPNAHLNGLGCPKCANKNITTEEFVSRAMDIHNGRYNYNKTVYLNTYSKVIITCPVHGDFYQRPCDHIHSKLGCPKCSKSKGELLISSILDRLKIKYVELFQVNIRNKKIIVDFAFNMGSKEYFVEYNGILHYKPIKFFGGALALEKLQTRDLSLQEYCINNGITLINIRYDDDNIEDIIKQAVYDSTSSISS